MEILLRRALLIFLGIDNCKSGQRIREPKCNEKEVGGGGRKGLTENSEALNVIDKILRARLGLPFPYNQKVYRLLLPCALKAKSII